MHRLLTRMATVFAVMLLLIVAARLIGRRNVNPAAALGLNFDPQSDQVCWHGICPGETMLDDAKALVNADPAFRPYLAPDDQCGGQQGIRGTITGAGLWAVCLTSLYNIVGHISLQAIADTNPVSSGMLIAQIGRPSWRPDETTCQSLDGNGNLWVFSYLGFAGHLIVSTAASNIRTLNGWRFTPGVSVTNIAIAENEQGMDYHNPDAAPWRGFTMPKVKLADCPG